MSVKPIGMLNAHPGKSRRFLLEGYRDTDRALRVREPRSGRVKGAVPEPRPGQERE